MSRIVTFADRYADDAAKLATERDRRIALGFTAQTSDGQSIPIDTRHESISATSTACR